MIQRLTITCLGLLLLGCSKRDPVREVRIPEVDFELTSCGQANYPEWSTSPYVLPYPVGKSYNIGLTHCSSSFHADGEPDQFAVDFDMNIGTLVTAVRAGRVIHIEESGQDGNFPNNLVVVQLSDNTFAQYMHLTQNGAIVELNDLVVQGDSIGFSGSTGLAGYPHLHFIVTGGGSTFPYLELPMNFRNTAPNPTRLTSGIMYRAEPY